MKVRLDDVHSPCRMCFLKGIFYDADSIICQRCEYNISIKLLQKVLRMLGGSQCAFCEKYRTGCAAVTGSDEDCGYTLDWKAACKRFGIEVAEK